MLTNTIVHPDVHNIVFQQEIWTIIFLYSCATHKTATMEPHHDRQGLFLIFQLRVEEQEL